jgi:predicted MPP superfamily phosphohydrolase
MKSMNSIKVFILFSFAVAFIVSCSDDSSNNPKKEKSTKFAVITDQHYYDPSLGTTGEAFEEYVSNDRKLIAESEAINNELTAQIVASDVEFVVVCGDMTKDSEKLCHQQVASYYSEIEASGKKVYVVPGNHDINHPHSFEYPPSGEPVSIPSVSLLEFEQIYNDYGFSEAIYRDPNSLTYIAEPVDGVWLFCMDVCNYNLRFPEINGIDGKFSDATFSWVLSKIEEAKNKNKEIIGVMHHNSMEHFSGMELIFGDYIISDWKNKSTQLAQAGMNIVFTGHNHATDIAMLSSGDSFIFDVQTGSPVTWVCPYRIVNYDIENKTMDINNHLIEYIQYDLNGMEFQDYAYFHLNGDFENVITKELVKIGATEEQAQQMIPLVKPTLMAYYHGDEPLMQDAQLIAMIEQLRDAGDPMGTVLANIMLDVWNDDTPDNNVIIDLMNGTIMRK